MTAINPASPLGRTFRQGSLVALPLAAVGISLVFGLLTNVAPFDHAIYQLLFVVPPWVAAPLVAGATWRQLPHGTITRLGIATGGLLGVAAAILAWLNVVALSSCGGSARSALDWWIPSIELGLLVGGGFAAICVIAARELAGRRRWRAVAYAIAGQVTLAVVGVGALGLLFYGICVRG